MRIAVAASIVFLAASALRAGELPPAAPREIDYAKDIAPLLEKHCLGCHGPEEPSSGFRLDLRTSLLRGGESGEPAIVIGNSADSHLIQLVAGLIEGQVMPPEGDRLTAEEVGLLRAWIDQGAKWPGQEADDSAGALTTDHWSFQPIRRPQPPALRDAAWPRNPIDAFILAKLEAAGISPSPEADPRTLARRMNLLLRGLPEEVASGELRVASAESESANSSSSLATRHSPLATSSATSSSSLATSHYPLATTRAADRLLASPHYGERWARHWLDIARFAETNGFETNTPRPNAWRYRDYVIAAFNEDKPYAAFVREQLAGDALGADAATGFMVAGAYDEVKSPDMNLTLMQRQDELHDMINASSTAFLGLTVGCARCHNHKFDPITQRDYYAFQAVLAGVQHGNRPLVAGDDPKASGQIARIAAELQQMRRELETLGLRPPVNAKQNEEAFEPVEAKYVRFTIAATNLYEPCLDELEIWSAETTPRNVALSATGAKATSSGDYQGNPKHQLAHIFDGQYGNSQSWISSEPGRGWVQIELAAPARIDRITWGRDRLGEFNDRLPTTYRIEVAVEPDQWRLVASSQGRLPLAGAGSAGASELPAEAAPQLSEADRRRAASNLQKIAALERRLTELSQPALAYAGNFQQPGQTHRLFRGDPLAPREPVAPAALESISPRIELEPDAAEQQRRLALADWIVGEKNPLAARVLVNRVWQHHFGQGLVVTPSDFGKMGVPPSHPELLDWLANELIDSGWSIKHVQRLILDSATWRQASRPREEALRIDAGCKLLWRFPPRRLEAEAVRDCLLAAAGTLDVSMGGPGFSAFEPNDNYVRVYEPKQTWGPESWRRMIYMTKVRMENDATFGAFDCPDAGQVTANRSRSTTPLQALNLLNSGFVVQQVELLAEAISRETGDSSDARIEVAFQRVLGRSPRCEEAAAARSLVSQHGLRALCRALVNSNEFLFVQ